MRDKLPVRLDAFPEKSAPHVEVLSETDIGDYVHRFIAHAVEPGERVCSYLPLPRNGAASGEHGRRPYYPSAHRKVASGQVGGRGTDGERYVRLCR